MPNNEDDRIIKALIAGALAGREDLYAQPPEPLGATRAEAKAHPPLDLATAVTLREARPGDPPPRHAANCRTVTQQVNHDFCPQCRSDVCRRARQARETPDTIAQPDARGGEPTSFPESLYLAIVAIAQSDAEVWLETITDERERAAFAAQPWTAALLSIEMHGMDNAIARLTGPLGIDLVTLGRDIEHGGIDVVSPTAIRALTWYDSAVRLAFDQAIDRSPAERLLERMSRATQGVDDGQ